MQIFEHYFVGVTGGASPASGASREHTPQVCLRLPQRSSSLVQLQKALLASLYFEAARLAGRDIQLPRNLSLRFALLEEFGGGFQFVGFLANPKTIFQ